MYKVGIDIGGSHIGIGIINDNGEILVKHEKDINKSYEPNEIVEEIISLLNLVCTKIDIDIEQIEKIGIGVPGIIKNNKIIHTPNLNLSEYNLEKEINRFIKKTIKIENDANCATIAEKLFGNLKDCNNGILITIGTGIGSGIIINGDLYKGSNGMGGEIGWTVIEENKTFEECASITALKKITIKEFKLKENLTGKELNRILQNTYKTNEVENNKINKIIEEYTESLSIGIANIIQTLDLDKIILRWKFCLL